MAQIRVTCQCGVTFRSQKLAAYIPGKEPVPPQDVYHTLNGVRTLHKTKGSDFPGLHQPRQTRCRACAKAAGQPRPGQPKHRTSSIYKAKTVTTPAAKGKKGK